MDNLLPFTKKCKEPNRRKTSSLEDCLSEIRVFKKFHVLRSLACQLWEVGSALNRPNENREWGFSDCRRRPSAFGLTRSCSPIAPRMARSLGGSESETFSRRLKRPSCATSSSTLPVVSFGESSLVLPPCLRKSSNAASVLGSFDHACGRRVWMMVPSPTSFLGRLRPLVETSPRFAVCVVKPSKLAAAIPDG